jgi:hypothetical protein
MNDRSFQARGKIGGLVEPSRDTAPWMERHRHDTVGIRQDLGSRMAHHVAQLD